MDHILDEPATLQSEVELTWISVAPITPVFQPIVNLSGARPRVVAVEALARGPRRSSIEMPGALFLAARRANRIAELDKRCLAAAIRGARDLPGHLDVFLNVHPSTLCNDCEFPSFVAEEAARAGIAPSRLVLEVLEHARADGCECRQLQASLQVLRGHGVRIAVDDISGATDDLRRALALRPDFLKVDAWVVRGARDQSRQRALLHAIAEQATRGGVRVIAEGIEELRDLEAVVETGINLAQGYLMSRPAPVEQFAHLAYAS